MPPPPDAFLDSVNPPHRISLGRQRRPCESQDKIHVRFRDSQATRMGATDNHSPARRPHNERSASAHSLSRGSPSEGALAKSQKGSSRQLHKSHAVGHGRHPHARVPSYGKGLHKLSKLGHGTAADVTGNTRIHARSASNSPAPSPTTPDFKRTSSHTSLPRTGSKVSFKKHHSEVSLSRNGSTAKLGNRAKSDKALMKTNLRKKGMDDAPVRGTADFQVGEDGPDDDWTEDSSSPYTTRHNSAAPSRPKTPVTQNLPSPDSSQGDLAERSPNILPHSPPESPKTDVPEANLHLAQIHSQANSERKASHYEPPDPQAVTNRLLSRNSLHQTPTSQTSTISANITPPARSGSPSDSQHSNRTPVMKEQSMPANGISRFLDASGSGTDSANPGSVSHLQSNLANLGRENINKNHHLAPSSSSSALHNPASRPSKSQRDLKTTTTSSRRSKSATTLNRTHTSTTSPPVSPSSDNPATKPGPSPFESARGADPTAGKSLTQLKLDLQRLSVQQRADALPPPPLRSNTNTSNNSNSSDPHNLNLQHNPLLLHLNNTTTNHTNIPTTQNGYTHGYTYPNNFGGMLSTAAGLWGGETTDMAARVGRQWESARREVDGTKRFWPEVVRVGMLNRRKGKGWIAGKGGMRSVRSSGDAASTRTGTSANSGGAIGLGPGRGGIRFEVGSHPSTHSNSTYSAYGRSRSSEEMGRDDEEEDREERDNVGIGGEALEGLVRRMWLHGGGDGGGGGEGGE